jgi:hypothetical protein
MKPKIKRSRELARAGAGSTRERPNAAKARHGPGGDDP